MCDKDGQALNGSWSQTESLAHGLLEFRETHTHMY